MNGMIGTWPAARHSRSSSHVSGSSWVAGDSGEPDETGEAGEDVEVEESTIFLINAARTSSAPTRSLGTKAVGAQWTLCSPSPSSRVVRARTVISAAAAAAAAVYDYAISAAAAAGDCGASHLLAAEFRTSAAATFRSPSAAR